MWSSDAIWHQWWSCSTLIQIMACHLFGANPSVLIDCLVDLHCNAFGGKENVGCKLSTILLRPQWVEKIYHSVTAIRGHQSNGSRSNGYHRQSNFHKHHFLSQWFNYLYITIMPNWFYRKFYHGTPARFQKVTMNCWCCELITMGPFY